MKKILTALAILGALVIGTPAMAQHFHGGGGTWPLARHEWHGSDSVVVEVIMNPCEL